MTEENPVRLGAQLVICQAKNVSLDGESLEALAEELPSTPPAWQRDYHFRGEEELTLRYLLALDALNFCFWPPTRRGEKWGRIGPSGERLTGYFALSVGLAELARDEPGFYQAENLAGISEEALGERLGEVPLLPWRARALREVGAVLSRFGSARAFFAQARGSTRRLVELLTSHLPMFRDASLHRGRWVPFLKRAQILCTDLWGTFGGTGPGAFTDLPWLTAFADYKLPQILRARGVLRLHPGLAQRIERGELIPWGSEEEVEIRAATIVAVERLASLRGDLLPFQIDWELWHRAQEPLPFPHHRTLTWAY